jgi:hypothetical protein
MVRVADRTKKFICIIEEENRTLFFSFRLPLSLYPLGLSYTIS